MSEPVRANPSDGACVSDKAEAIDRRRLDRQAAAERRLADALRANLRRRKASRSGDASQQGTASPGHTVPGTDDDGDRG